MFGGPNQNFTWGTRQQNPAGWGVAPDMSRDQALAMVGKPPGFSYHGENDRNLDAYYGRDVSGRGGNYGYTGDTWGGGSASGGGGGASSIGGVSAVNPQAGQANELDSFRRYEESAYGDLMRRLSPALEASQRGFDQSMVDRGLAPGSEAYRTASADLARQHNDARTGAAFQAMQFGLGAQNQSFQQDHARSALANALLRAQWQKDIGLGQIGLGWGQLGENARQYDLGLGLSYDTLGQRAYEFDASQDYDYWDRGNYWDYNWDRAASDDYFGALDRDYRNQAHFDDLILALFGGQGPGTQGLNPLSGYVGPQSEQMALYNFLFGGG